MHDLDEAARRQPGGKDRGPLWRTSAFRSAMNGWRDFALRDWVRAVRRAGTVVPNEFAKPIRVSRELKGEGQDADDQPADRSAAYGAEVAQEGSGAAAVAAEARCLHARLHYAPE